MGFSISKIFGTSSIKTDAKIIILGLDGVGKTTLLYKLKLGEVVSTFPTEGFNYEHAEFKNIRLSIWDLSGQSSFRPLWKTYTIGTQCVVFVIDSCDRERVKLAKEELYRILDIENLKDVPLLVFANKQDKCEMSVGEVTESLELERLDREYHVEGASVTTGAGLFEGFDWITQVINQKNQAKG